MKLGVLADIHEQVEALRRAIAALRRQGADRFVVLGDVFETGQRIEETVRLLREVDAVVVWGNHDLGLCHEPTETIRARYAAVQDYMQALRPRLELEGCLFTHVEPWLDPHKVEDLWYFDGPPDTPDKLARSFAASSQPVSFVGHFHRWLLGTPDSRLCNAFGIGGKKLPKTTPKWDALAHFCSLPLPQWENLENALQSPGRPAAVAGGGAAAPGRR
jgi:hypothetical protein